MKSTTISTWPQEPPRQARFQSLIPINKLKLIMMNHNRHIKLNPSYSTGLIGYRIALGMQPPIQNDVPSIAENNK